MKDSYIILLLVKGIKHPTAPKKGRDLYRQTCYAALAARIPAARWKHPKRSEQIHMQNLPIFTRPTTHSKKFHADEVCGMAFLRAIGAIADTTKIIRTLDQHVIDEADLVLDIGRVYSPKEHRYDHHQNDFKEVRKCGTSFASFGLVVRHFALFILSEEEYEQFDYHFVRPIDAADNGQMLHTGKVVTFQHALSMFMPTWLEGNTDELIDKAFDKAVEFAKTTIELQIKHTKALVQAITIVREAYNNSTNKKIVELPHHLPWYEELSRPEYDALVVIYPHIRGGYAIQVVPLGADTFDSKIQFPKAWCGLIAEDLQQVTGVADASFAHKAGFLVTAKTKEGAYQLAQKAIEQAESR